MGSNPTREALEKREAELFGVFPKSLDWAEDLARRTVVLGMDLEDFMENLGGGRWTREQNVAWALATALAGEIRGLRRQAREAKEIHVKGRVEEARRMLREQFASPDFMAEFIRDGAGILDGQGKSAEANVLRDAATIMDTEF